MVNETVSIKVARQEATESPAVTSEYQVPYTQYTTVLDALDWLKATLAPTLAYRASCHSGICGSCGVMVNGRPVLACETFVAGYRKSGLTIEPLARISVLRDLIVDTDSFLNQLRSALAWQLPTTPVVATSDPESGLGTTENPTKPDVTLGSNCEVPGAAAPNVIRNQTPEQLAAYQQLTYCINCLLCYSACPQYSGSPRQSQSDFEGAEYESPDQFIGPAAIALAVRWSKDSRDKGAEQRFAALAEQENGIWPCTQDGNCTLVCPKGLDPKAIIGELQRQALSG